MNDSKLNMSKLAAESGHKNKRLKSSGRNDAERLELSRLGDAASGKDSAETAIRKEDERLYQAGLKFYTDAYAAVQAERTFPVEQAISVTRKLIINLQNSKGLLSLAVYNDYRDDTIAHHSLNVAIISILLGNDLGLSESALVQLGTAALLHDIGTARIPESLYNKPSQLTEEELRQLRQRTLLSQQILEQTGGQYSHLAEIAVQVYERLDGSGYPSGLTAGDIHEYAQIVGLADLYEALVHSRPHRDRFLHFPSIKEIIRSGKQAYDRRLLKALVNTVSLFPVSSFVQLNSGAVGRVLETDSRDPLRPRLRILLDAQEKPVLSERIVDLRENPLLFIVDAVAEEDVQSASV